MRKLPWAWLLLVPFANGKAQTPFKDTSAPSPLLSVYLQTVNNPSDLYNGRTYHVDFPLLYGNDHPFLDTNTYQTGSVVYFGKLFENLQLKFDLMKQTVLLQHSETDEGLEFQDGALDRFTIGGHRFLRIRDSSTLQPGYYDVLYDGTTTVLATYRKEIGGERLVDQRLLYYLNPQINRYYVLHRGQWFRVRNQKGLYEALGDATKVLKPYLRREGLSFRKKPAETVIAAARYMDQSSPR
ncbi:hypothetical protein [Flavihumibacter petaseus]|uniref:Uncharacterized protein n=1 Tax=Flavihumibacter petaseus NBRC 106054 TaxID=1220578 RepID=A0A0E9N0V6_9BACT|nr:hypothetical protein [Flavihumibacter petaseus]GAO42995.1 hypothetical protein FPE01S_02_01000 [Flavihumibacter petaseus NBRC 106054]